MKLEKDHKEDAAFSTHNPLLQSFEYKDAAIEQVIQSRNVKNQKGVVKGMTVFLGQFYDRYLEQQKTNLYLAGQSYTGKFIPSIAYAIM
ncbi:hypothetical protein FBU30_003143 [Linnemannia zychae]|nr:hypothetical protein FBU30_003143 [Linnemannia zychae]